MHIIYGFSNCTDKKYNELMRGTGLSILRPDQKYHGLLIKGLRENGADIKCFSGLPINRSLTKKLIINEKNETENGVRFHYYKTINLPVFRQLSIFCGAFFGVLKEKRQENTYIICDCLNIANAYGMMLAAKIKKIPVLTIVTDIPDMMYGEGITRKIANRFFNSVNGFVLLTHAMNSKVNPDAKPNIVLEGHVDSNLKLDKDEDETVSTEAKQIIYAGSVKKIYGIKNLVDGFLLANLQNCKLIIYGDGDYSEELSKISKKYDNIEYLGVRENDEVVKAELSADLLVNPRPTAPEYTKYSFPSKNMEYMVSGTPVLTTKLPGMPEEYYPYVYLINDETPIGISDTLREIFSFTDEDRIKKGSSAREFVLKYKSNIYQAGKIIDFLEKEVKK